MAQDAVRSEGEHRPVTILCCVDSRLEPRQFVPTGAAHVWDYRNPGGRRTDEGGEHAPLETFFRGFRHPPAPRPPRHTRQRAVGSVSGSPWTRKKSAGPPSTMRPASGSFRRSPPRTVAEASASQGFRPASTRDSTSQARWFARRDPPPKSVPVATPTPARYARRTLST